MDSKLRRFIAYAGLLSLLILLDSNAAFSQQNPTLTLSTNQITFFNTPSGGTSTQTLTLSSSGAAGVAINTANLPSWVQVTPNGSVNVTAGSPTTISVTATPPSGLGPGTYDSLFSISNQNGTDTPQTVVITTVVSGTSALSAKPSSLVFTAQPGASEATPKTASIQISSSNGTLEYNVTASTMSGQNWLIPFTLNGTTGSTAVAASPLIIGVNPSGLAAGTYLGQVLVESATSSDSVTIAVALTVGANSAFTVTPSTLQPFNFQSNTGLTPPSQQVTVTSTSSSGIITAALNPPVPWATVSVTPASAPGAGSATTITIAAVPQFNVGSNATSLLISNGTSTVAIPVIYAVGIGQVPQVTPNQLTFTSSASQIPSSQTVQISLASPGNPIGISATSDSSWLTASVGSTTTPATVTVTANPIGLAAGTYTGTITVKPTNGDLYLVPIMVKLTVSGAPPLLTSGPPVLLFSNQIGQAGPAAQILQTSSTLGTLPFTVATSSNTNAPNCTANFLQASLLPAGSGTAGVAVGVTPTGLTPGICSGTVTLSYTNGGIPGSIQVPVIVETSASALISISVPAGFGYESANVCAASGTSASGTGTASGGTGTAAGGTGTAAQCPIVMRQLALTSTDGVSSLSFTATASNGGSTPWLFVAPNSGQTPAALAVLIDPSGLAPGNYNGLITIASGQINASALPMQITIPISLTVRSNIAVTASQSSLSFTQVAGGSVPASQTFTLTSTAPGATFNAIVPASSNCGWVQVSPMSGAATGTITIGVASNTLNQNTYTCPIQLVLNGASTASIPVTATLTVTPKTGAGTTVTASQSTLNFTQTAGGSVPASQTFTLTASAPGASYAAVLPTSANCGWVQVSPMSGTLSTTPSTITISVASNTLAANPYSCPVQFNLTGAATASVMVTPILTVTAASGGGVTVTASPTTLAFTETAGGALPASKTFTLTASGTGASYAAVLPTTANCGWVQVSPMSGTLSATPSTITISVAANTLAANPYSCPIQFNLTGAATASLTVTPILTVTAASGGGGVTVTALPATLNFAETAGGSAPVAQTFTLTASGTGASYAAVLPTTTNCGWVQVSPMSGTLSNTTPTTIMVSVAANTLMQNAYSCPIQFNLTGAAATSLTVTPVLTVSAAQAQTLTAVPTALTFVYSNAFPQPASQQLVVNATGTATNGAFSIASTSSGWLTVTPSQGSAPASITVSVNPLNVGSGTAPFSGMITITPASGAPITIPVTLNHQ